MVARATLTRTKPAPLAPRTAPAQARADRAAAKPPTPLHHVPVLTIDPIGIQGTANIRLDGMPVGVIVPPATNRHTNVSYLWKTFQAGAAPSRELAEAHALGAVWSLVPWAERQAAWSQETFGPHRPVAAAVDEIRKDLRAVGQGKVSLERWTRIIAATIDGFLRAGGTPRQLIESLDAHQREAIARTQAAKQEH